MREPKEHRARDDTDDHRGASVDLRQSLGERAKDDATKEPLFKDRSEQRRHEGDHDETRTMRRLEEVVDRFVEALEVKGLVGNIDTELTGYAEQRRRGGRSAEVATDSATLEDALRGGRNRSLQRSQSTVR